MNSTILHKRASEKNLPNTFQEKHLIFLICFIKPPEVEKELEFSLSLSLFRSFFSRHFVSFTDYSRRAIFSRANPDFLPYNSLQFRNQDLIHSLQFSPRVAPCVWAREKENTESEREKEKRMHIAKIVWLILFAEMIFRMRNKNGAQCNKTSRIRNGKNDDGQT